MAAVVVAVLVSVAHGQTHRFCEGELGQADWACDVFTQVPPEAFEEFLPLPGSPNPDNPSMYKQIAGDPAFDEATGLRNDNTAVFVLTEGAYFTMLAESNGEAVLFDAPEGMGQIHPIRLARYSSIAAVSNPCSLDRGYKFVDVL